MSLIAVKVDSSKAKPLYDLENVGEGFNLSHITLRSAPKNASVQVFLSKGTAIKGQDEESFLFATLENPGCRQFQVSLYINDADCVEISIVCEKGYAAVDLIGFVDPELDFNGDMDGMDEMDMAEFDVPDKKIGQANKKRSTETKLPSNKKKTPAVDESSSDSDSDSSNLVDTMAEEVAAGDETPSGSSEPEGLNVDRGSEDSSCSEDEKKILHNESSSDDESSSGNVNPESLEAMLNNLDVGDEGSDSDSSKDVPCDSSSSEDEADLNLQMDPDSDSDSSSDEPVQKKKEIAKKQKTNKKVTIVSSESDSSEESEPVKVKEVAKKQKTNKKVAIVSSESDSSETDSDEEPIKEKAEPMKKKAELKAKKDSDDKGNDKVKDSYIKSLIAFLNSNGKTRMGNLGSSCRKPTSLTDKLSKVIADNKDIFTVKNDFVELKHK